jgi:N6-L-threonylcarbamoyladenine synthase
MKDIIILGIETSCDETSISIVKNGKDVLTNVINSQIETHKAYGGVVPEIASRSHISVISQVLEEALTAARLDLTAIDAVAVTYGPGLVGALLVGINFAKSLAFAISKPLIAVNHIEGHISANYIAHKDLAPPFITLVVSGGHTHLVLLKDYGSYEVIGMTRDDAAGEAFDKVARSIGLGYPGGPLIDQISKQGNREAIKFPRATLEKDSLDFSFSGLKSSVLNYQNSVKMKNGEINVADVAASFQEAVVDVLVSKTMDAAKRFGINTVAMAGGVASNSRLREVMGAECQKNNFKFLYPPSILCTDNGAMIACAGYYKFLKNEFAGNSLNAEPNLRFENFAGGQG